MARVVVFATLFLIIVACAPHQPDESPIRFGDQISSELISHGYTFEELGLPMVDVEKNEKVWIVRLWVKKKDVTIETIKNDIFMQELGKKIVAHFWQGKRGGV